MTTNLEPRAFSCIRKELPAFWLSAATHRQPLVVKESDGRISHYHPPYPYSDEEVEMFRRYPGMVVCLGPLPSFMMEVLMRRPPMPSEADPLDPNSEFDQLIAETRQEGFAYCEVKAAPERMTRPYPLARRPIR